jgi:hypothetical protein
MRRSSQVRNQRSSWEGSPLVDQDWFPCICRDVATSGSAVRSRFGQSAVDCPPNPIVVEAGATKEYAGVIYLHFRQAVIFDQVKVDNVKGEQYSVYGCLADDPLP